MDFHIITGFPKLFTGAFDESIIKRAKQKELANINLYDLRQFTYDKHHQIDDYPYSGGPGMILKPEPICLCIEYILEKIGSLNRRIIYLTPQGEKYTQPKAQELSHEQNLILLCGHYKGIDERVFDFWKMEEISIGDYVVTGGELPAMVLVDSIIRLIPGVLNDLNSATSDSFANQMLDCPYYTRPEIFRGIKVPDVLASGNHAEIEKWKKKQAIQRTLQRRSDLLTEEQWTEFRKYDESGGLVDEQS